MLGIILKEGDDGIIHRYFDEESDVRFSIETQEDVLGRIREHGVRSLIMVEKIFGCPHEEGIDYPLGESCPQCPFWKGKDRFEDLD